MDTCGLSRNQPAVTSTELYTSHEALLLPYEQALTRFDAETGSFYAGSAHLLWVGERTRGIHDAHVEFARGISNRKLSQARASISLRRASHATDRRRLFFFSSCAASCRGQGGPHHETGRPAAAVRRSEPAQRARPPHRDHQNGRRQHSAGAAAARSRRAARGAQRGVGVGQHAWQHVQRRLRLQDALVGPHHGRAARLLHRACGGGLRSGRAALRNDRQGGYRVRGRHAAGAVGAPAAAV
ncbi:3-deoxy-7-phosphoheptulonate synthase [Gracilaria domingensis]|nr:3-deoxy-7-phosphoheptulonate synthase [Gracilaria domingensis]